jgi:hypothetical protein
MWWWWPITNTLAALCSCVFNQHEWFCVVITEAEGELERMVAGSFLSRLSPLSVGGNGDKTLDLDVSLFSCRTVDAWR